MNRRLLIILVAIAGVLFVAVLITALVVRLQNPPAPDSTNGVSTNSFNTTNSAATTRNTASGDAVNTADDSSDSGATQAKPVTTTDQAKINSLAISFTERYGSFSSDTGTENIEALQSFMTDNMRKQADRVAGNNADNQTNEFYGISTQAANVNITDFAEGATGATVEVSTRRTETKGSADPVLFTQTARLQLKKIGNAWRVDKFQWK